MSANVLLGRPPRRSALGRRPGRLQPSLPSFSLADAGGDHRHRKACTWPTPEVGAGEGRSFTSHAESSSSLVPPSAVSYVRSYLALTTSSSPTNLQVPTPASSRSCQVALMHAGEWREQRSLRCCTPHVITSTYVTLTVLFYWWTSH
jgi:hypothetical protein